MFFVVYLSLAGDTTASAQIVLFTNDYVAPNADAVINKVHTVAELDENTYK